MSTTTRSIQSIKDLAETAVELENQYEGVSSTGNAFLLTGISTLSAGNMRSELWRDARDTKIGDLMAVASLVSYSFQTFALSSQLEKTISEHTRLLRLVSEVALLKVTVNVDLQSVISDKVIAYIKGNIYCKEEKIAPDAEFDLECVLRTLLHIKSNDRFARTLASSIQANDPSRLINYVQTEIRKKGRLSSEWYEPSLAIIWGSHFFSATSSPISDLDLLDKLQSAVLDAKKKSKFLLPPQILISYAQLLNEMIDTQGCVSKDILSRLTVLGQTKGRAGYSYWKVRLVVGKSLYAVSLKEKVHPTIISEARRLYTSLQSSARCDKQIAVREFYKKFSLSGVDRNDEETELTTVPEVDGTSFTPKMDLLARAILFDDQALAAKIAHYYSYPDVPTLHRELSLVPDRALRDGLKIMISALQSLREKNAVEAARLLAYALLRICDYVHCNLNNADDSFESVSFDYFSESEINTPVHKFHLHRIEKIISAIQFNEASISFPDSSNPTLTIDYLKEILTGDNELLKMQALSYLELVQGEKDGLLSILNELLPNFNHGMKVALAAQRGFFDASLLKILAAPPEESEESSDEGYSFFSPSMVREVAYRHLVKCSCKDDIANINRLDEPDEAIQAVRSNADEWKFGHDNRKLFGMVYVDDRRPREQENVVIAKDGKQYTLSEHPEIFSDLSIAPGVNHSAFAD